MARGGGRGVGWVRGYYDNYSWKSKIWHGRAGYGRKRGGGMLFSSRLKGKYYGEVIKRAIEGFESELSLPRAS